MMDSDLEAIDDTPLDFVDDDPETDTLEDDQGIEDGDELGEDEQPEEAFEGEGPDEETADSDDQVRVTLDDGEETTLAELKRGYFREADYTRKTTEIASERSAIQEEKQAFTQRSQFVENTLQNLQNYASNMVPPEPDLALARSDPAQYQYDLALRQGVIAELQPLFQMKQDLKGGQQQFSQEDQAAAKRNADAELVKAMPRLKDPTVKAAFDAANIKTAQEFGFSESEIQTTMDPRILQLVHFAQLGKRAETNQRNARRRVDAPRKGKARPAQSTGATAQNRKAKERLIKSGRIDDAMGIDFD